MSRGTSDTARSFKVSNTGLSPSMAGFPNTILLPAKSLGAVHNPGLHAIRFRLFPSRFLVSRCTLDPAQSVPLSLTGLSPSPAGFPKTFLLGSSDLKCGPNPGVHALRFGLFPFRSPLLWKSINFLSLPRPT